MQTDGIRSDLARLVAASSGSRAVERVLVVREPLLEPRGASDPAEVADPGPAAGGLAREIAELARQVAGLRDASARQSDRSGAPLSLAAPASTQRSVAGRVADAARAARSPFGPALSPLISGLAKLFGSGSGSGSVPPALPQFELPGQISIDAGFSRSLGEAGQVTRGIEAAPRISTPQAVAIHVNAIDSRSFLDHSDEIARAVREAMLNTHALNDVVSDL